MPRTTKAQTTIRAGSGASNVNTPTDPITSYAPYVSYAHISADRSVGREEMAIGEALAGFGSTVAKVAVEQREADAKRRRLKGQADALTDGPPPDWGIAREAILADPDKGQAYLDAYLKQGASVAAVAKANTLADQLEQRTDLNNVDAFNEWFAAEVKNDLETFTNLESPEATIAYAGKLEEAELSLRNVVRKRAADKAYIEAEANFNMVAQSEFEDMVKAGATGRDMMEMLARQRREGEAVLLTSKDINEAQIRAVGEYAKAEGRPELLNLFDYSRPDSQDPTKSVPGLAYSKEHGAMIEDYRSAATKEHDTKVAEQLKKTQYAAQKFATNLMVEGKTAQLEAFVDTQVEQGVFSTAVGASYYKEIYKADKKAARIARNMAHITSGRTEAIPADQRKEVMEAYGDRIIEKVQALGTAEAAHEGMKDILTTGASVGEMYPAYKAKLQKLNILDPEQFVSTIQLSGVVQAVAPSLYYDNVPKETRAAIDMAVRMQEGGHTQDETMALMQEFQKPEAVARRKELAGDSKLQAKRRTSIKSNLDIDSDHINGNEVTDWVAETALDYMVMTGTDDYNDAKEYAIDQYEASFAKVNLGGGRGYVSVYKGQLGLPDNIDQQFQWFSDDFTKEMRAANPGMDTDVSFYLVPDAASRHSDEREFIVQDSLGRVQMEVRDGLGVPMRIGQRELEKQWRIGMVKNAEEEQAMQQAERLRRDARVLRNRRYYGVDGDVLRKRYRAIGKPPAGEPDVSPLKPAGPDQAPELNPAMEEAVALVAGYESFRGAAYAATPAEEARGIWTIGYGATEGVKPGQKMSEPEAKAALATQVQHTADAVAHAVGPFWNNLNDTQQAIVVSLVYNVDKDVVGQFKRSRALRALQRGDLETFKYEAFDPEAGFVKQTQKDGTKKVVKGLVKRRQDELKRFNKATTQTLARNQ